ncbi:MAG: hypothetical protein E7666_05090 [Ruminococcaceae bacterium]|nr:hypothetical protein [Oscillospiraceae bacterium]
MKTAKRIIWGVLLIAAGVLLALNALEITHINIFFDGWWTLFIIVPCTIGLFTERDKSGNFIGLAVGVLLLLCCLGILSFSMLWKLILPICVVLIGLKLLFGGIKGNRANRVFDEMKEKGSTPRTGYAAFSGCDMNFSGEPFEGADVTAVFGGVKCDLRNAVIERDCALRVTAVFGGVDVLLPPNVNVKVETASFFGGVSDKSMKTAGAPTLYINGVCMFGGVDVK